LPRVDFEDILYVTFNNLDFSKTPASKQFFSGLATQIGISKPGVEFKNYPLRDNALNLLNNLSSGSINNMLIDGKGEACLTKEQQNIIHDYISYMPANGFFGPEPLLNDHGSTLDGYGKYFMSNNVFIDLQNLYLNRKLKNKILNLELLNTIISGYQISAFNINLWGKIGTNPFACLVNKNYTACLER
jgi:hypothetical protein